MQGWDLLIRDLTALQGATFIGPAALPVSTQSSALGPNPMGNGINSDQAQAQISEEDLAQA